MKSYSVAAALAGLISTVAGHGYITDPSPRMPGDTMKKACGEQMYNNQFSDNYGNVQGELQVANGQTDYDADACNVWLCKGYKFEDNTENVQSYTAGETVTFAVEIRAPHTGVANVSIVKTSSNTVIGSALQSWDVYGSNSAPIPEDQKSFDITIPSDLGSECSTAGDCVIQWFWDAASIDQTYEACVDFTVGGSGSDSPAPASSAIATSTAAATSAAATSVAAVATSSAKATSTSVPTATSVAAAPTATGSSSSTLPEEFTLDTFISWLESAAGTSSSKKVRHGRVHPRAF